MGSLISLMCSLGFAPQTPTATQATTSAILPLSTASPVDVSTPQIEPTPTAQPQASTSTGVNMTTKALWCLIEGQSQPFGVTVPNETHIDDLKELIWEKGIRSKDILAKDLQLFRVELVLDDNLEASLRTLKPEELKMTNFDFVSKFWPAQLVNDKLMLRVFVKLPDAMLKHAHSPDSPDSFPPAKHPRTEIDLEDAWLRDLHSKIWGGKADELFHEVNITVEHYNELQKRLVAIHPDRESPSYEGDNVGSIKSAVLQDFNLLSGELEHKAKNDVVLEGGDGDGLDNELCDLFPTTIRYLDLSAFNILQTCIPSRLFIREEYDVITAMLEKRPKTNYGSAIISGQPGTGKTAYLYLRVIQEMVAERPFLYQSAGGHVYYISDTFEPIAQWSLLDPIVAFVDLDRNVEPQTLLMLANVQIIAAASPKGTLQRWSKSYPGVLIDYVVNLWSPVEFFLTGIFIHPVDVTYERLKESISYLGFNPRRSFRASSSTSALTQYKGKIVNAIQALPVDTPISSLLTDSYVQGGVSHTIFELFPTQDTRLLTQAHVGAVSMWALDILLTVCERRQRDATAEFYRMIAEIPSAASLRGRIMERQVLKYFDSFETQHAFTLRSLSTSDTVQWEYPGPTKRVDFQSKSFTRLLNDAVAAGQPSHFVPQDPNFPALDSIIYAPATVLTGIQVTTADDHPELVSGFQRIQQCLPLKSPLDHLRPSTSPLKHWKLIFVVPEDMAAGFRKQRFKGDTKTGEWAQKVDQYVLGIANNSLWGRE